MAEMIEPVAWAEKYAALAARLHYDRTNGTFTWKSGHRAGKVAGSRNSDGYVLIQIGIKKIKAHRLAWFMETGNIPANHIDHINGDPGDNRIANLREATHKQNHQNRAKSSRSSSQYQGVSWHKMFKKWSAQIVDDDGRRRHLGLFADELDAAKAYLDAKAVMHPFQPTPREQSLDAARKEQAE